MGKVGTYIRKIKDPKMGTPLYVRRLATYSKYSEAQVVDLSTLNTGIRQHEMQSAFAALGMAIENFVLNGHSVRLKGVGSFSLSCKTGVFNPETGKYESAGSSTMSEVTPDKIRGVFVRFRPDTAIKQELLKTQFFDCTKTFFGGTKGGYDYTQVK